MRLDHGPKPAHTVEHGDPQDSQQADPLHGSQRSENDGFQDPWPHKLLRVKESRR